MKKSKLTDNTPIFVVKIDQYVTGIAFMKALVNYFYNKKTELPEKLTKTEALNILKVQLKRYGYNGEYCSGEFEAAEDEIAVRRENLWVQARVWVDKNYPYLIVEKKIIQDEKSKI